MVEWKLYIFFINSFVRTFVSVSCENFILLMIIVFSNSPAKVLPTCCTEIEIEENFHFSIANPEKYLQ